MPDELPALPADYRACRLCPRLCGVDRCSHQTGHCGETSACRVAACLPHLGEEPALSGSRGSGTLFFTGCSCRCFFCQNHQISQDAHGTPVTPQHMLELCVGLIQTGVHNLNFVTPDHFWPHIEETCQRLRALGHTLPFVFNSSGYHRKELVDRFARTMDIFLPDFKCLDPALAEHYMQAPDYPRRALEALQSMVEMKGFLDPWDTSGSVTARRGVLLRHLVLPGHTDDSIELLRLLRSEFGRFLPLSIMSQFMPTPACLQRRQLDRRTTSEEYRLVCHTAAELGFEHIYIQQDGGDDGYFPDFESPLPFLANQRP